MQAHQHAVPNASAEQQLLLSSLAAAESHPSPHTHTRHDRRTCVWPRWSFVCRTAAQPAAHQQVSQSEGETRGQSMHADEVMWTGQQLCEWRPHRVCRLHSTPPTSALRVRLLPNTITQLTYPTHTYRCDTRIGHRQRHSSSNRAGRPRSSTRNHDSPRKGHQCCCCP